MIAVSDDFFADVANLLKVEVCRTYTRDPGKPRFASGRLAHTFLHIQCLQPALSLKGQFGPNGALFDGWETRRHNPTFDWCIIKLGVPGSIHAFDIDTSHFNGKPTRLI